MGAERDTPHVGNIRPELMEFMKQKFPRSVEQRGWKAKERRKIGTALRSALRETRPDALIFPDADPAEQAMLRRRVRAAVLRTAAADHMANRITGSGFSAALALAGLAGYVYAQGWYALAGLAGYLAIALVLMTVILLPLPAYLINLLIYIMWIMPFPMIWLAFTSPSTIVGYARHVEWFGDPQVTVYATRQFFCGAATLLPMAIAYQGAKRAGTWWRGINSLLRMGSTPYDRLIYHWAKTLTMLEETTPRCPAHTAIRSCHDQLMELAKHADYELRLPHVALSGAERRVIRQTAKRVGSRLVQHHLALVRAGSGPGIDEVIASLRAGLAALAVGDLGELTSHIDASERSNSIRPALLAWFRRLLPGIVCAGIALALPLTPAIADRPDLTINVRITLLVSAALSIFSVPDPVANRTMGALKGVLTGRFSA